LELSLQQYLKEDSTPEEDEAEDKREKMKNLPKELQRLIESHLGPQDPGRNED
jgi:hypothetical protein